MKRIIILPVLAAAAAGITACSSGPSQSTLGPFAMTPCQMGWSDGTADGQFFATRAAAQAAADSLNTANEQAATEMGEGSATPYTPAPAAEFTVTLTATADLSGGFTVAYYNAQGTETGTGTATLAGNGPEELTAGQHAVFTDTMSAPSGAASCKVIAGPGN